MRYQWEKDDEMQTATEDSAETKRCALVWKMAQTTTRNARIMGQGHNITAGLNSQPHTFLAGFYASTTTPTHDKDRVGKSLSLGPAQRA